VHQWRDWYEEERDALDLHGAVPLPLACPCCGNRVSDELFWDDDTLVCCRCDTEYKPGEGE
jgi:hypothetical protein